MAAPATPRTGVSTLRRVIVGFIVVSFGIAAIGGIIVLLGASLGTTAGNVLGTTAVVGGFSVAVLCCASLAGRRLQLFGSIGAAVSILAAALIVYLIWSSGSTHSDALFKWTWTLVAASAAFALASLLLLLADRRRAQVRIGLVITVVLFAAVLGMVIYLIWNGEHIRGELFSRVLGILGILAALGAVVVPVMSLLLPDARPGGQIPPLLADRLVAAAAARGVTVEELVAPLLAEEDSAAEVIDPRA